MTVTLPASPRRILLINPTRYLGNLLIAGGLIQDFAAHCEGQGIIFRVVLDGAFAPLMHNALPEDLVYWYPRREIRQAGLWQKLRLYLGTVFQIRRFKADIAFNIEEDSTSDRLTRWSGAHFILGCSTSRHTRGYSLVLPINFASRPAAQRHRWYSFQEVFAALGLPAQSPGYLRLTPAPLSAELGNALQQTGFNIQLPFAVIHAGATKDYKRWPAEYFAALARLLRAQNLQVVFIGAGQDAVVTQGICKLIEARGVEPGIYDFTNQMSLAQLSSFVARAQVMIGNDSGPFHLATSVGTPGVVIFGPTEAALWRPLGERVILLQKREVCSPQCSRKQCIYDHRCLTGITPEQVLTASIEAQNLPG